jgi:hypothetical protein
MEVGGQLQAPAALPRGKEPPVPIGKEAGWTPKTVWTLRKREKSLASARKSNRSSSAVPCRYTDWAILAPYSFKLQQ